MTPKAGSIEAQALMQAVEKKVGDFLVPVFTAEHLAAIALQLGRAKDKIRLAQFAEAGVLDSAKFKAILQRHGLEKKWDNFRQSLRDDA
ncbi:MAG: hypothetical protein HY736_15795 [Verrucomicrobia bacterium]|nr:hypothetical protein [Verrucomicrobiota bacterium]